MKKYELKNGLTVTVEECAEGWKYMRVYFPYGTLFQQDIKRDTEIDSWIDFYSKMKLWGADMKYYVAIILCYLIMIAIVFQEAWR